MLPTNGKGYIGKNRDQLAVVTIKVIVPKGHTEAATIDIANAIANHSEVGMLGLIDREGPARPMTDKEWEDTKDYFTP